MKEYRKKLKLRIGGLIVYNFALLIVVALGLFHPLAATTEAVFDFISGLNVGFYLFVQVGLIYLLIKYFGAINDEEKLETVYIYENDERRKFIKNQVGGVAINILLAFFAFGTIGAGFFNEIVFFSLFTVLCTTALVKGTLKIYFNRKV